MANKTDDKTLTLGRLYALRAGLSVVAQEKEKADGIIDRAKKDKQRAIDDADKRIKNAEKALSNEEQALKEIPHKISALEAAANSPGATPRVIAKVFIVIFMIGGILLFLIGLARLILGIKYASADPLPGVWASLVGWLPFGWFWAFLLCGGLLAGGMIASLVNSDDIFNCSLWERNRARSEITDLRYSITSHEAAVEQARTKITKTKQQKQADIKAADAAIDEARKKATEHAVAGLTVIEGLENTFGDMIDARDWENTDIIIYALETRRAEDIKEALAVVDHERHTERIIEAVNAAGQEICKTINTGLRRLQGEMTRCFGLLSDQIVVQTEIMANEMSGIRSGISSNNEYIAKLTSQQSMSNALLAKANENSAAIASEVAALRSTVVINHNKEQAAFAHYTYWGS